jgi:hypothetical protein
MASDTRDDRDLIDSIMSLVRLCRTGGDRPSKDLHDGALAQLGYILYRIAETAPDLFRRIEPMLIQGLAPEDWKTVQSALRSQSPPPRPPSRKRRRRA